MSNLQVTDRGTDYAKKMDAILTESCKQWWESLTKAELLQWMSEQPSLDANTIRNLFNKDGCVLRLNVDYDTGGQRAIADFGTNFKQY